MNKAKLINNTLTYATNYMLIGENMVSNPFEAQLIADGYKDVIYEEVDEVVEPYGETETNIIVYTQKYIPSENESI